MSQENIMSHELASELVHALYDLILKREPDFDGLDHYISLLQAGTKYSDLIVGFKNSEEYKKNLSFKRIPEEHPLGNNHELYTPEFSPYYTFRGLFRPLALHIETINICNNDCIFCHPQAPKPHIMSIKTVESIVHQYEEIGGGECCLTPSKGEIFLDKELLEKLRVVKPSPLVSAIYFHSNAAGLEKFSDEYLADILQHTSGIAISVYGLDEEEHFSITKHNDYQQNLIGIARLLRLGNPKNITLNPRRLKKRDQNFFEAWHSEIAALSGVNKDEIRLTQGTLEYVPWAGISNASWPLPQDAIWSSNKNVITENCLRPLLAPRIFSNGDVTFCGCGDVRRELLVGNIHDTSLKNIYESDKYKKLFDWKKYGIPTLCQNCFGYAPLAAHQCLGGLNLLQSPVKIMHGH